ncbi:MAG: dienelactone hydrolase family protein [Rhodanobacteraceae bacterium]
MTNTPLLAWPRVNYVRFPSAEPGSPLALAAQLRVPRQDERAPAVVIAHGTAGIDSRGAYHAQALNAAGIATLELDMWAPRGLDGGIGQRGRPESVVETLPDAFGALLYLAARPDIDPQRIGIMGFSWGGIVSMLTATRPYNERYLGSKPLRFAAHAPFYPICWTYNKVPGHEFRELTGAPVLIQSGACDDYDEPDTCETLVRSLPDAAQAKVTVTIYPDAAHGFNAIEPAHIVNDPYSHLGQGGAVKFEAHPGAAAKSRQATVEFFARSFAAAGSGRTTA